MTDVVLGTRDLTVEFGGVRALHRVSLTCLRGQLTGLIGPNGAGKTTFVDAVTGFLSGNASGTVELEGINVLGRPPHQLARQGLTRTWQSLELFDDLTVRANLEIASGNPALSRVVTEFFGRRRPDTRVDEVLELLDLQDVADRKPRELSHGKRKLVGVARALSAHKTKVLLLDEPAAGLDRPETLWFGGQLRRLIDLGYTMMLIDHDMTLVLSVCDHIITLVYGEAIASGSPTEIRNDAKVISAYLGKSAEGHR